ncbi:MAG: undecaprenyl/decaprenyl-phosphate alpha-N-acetylglucosaminyl 1-phosphate transferase [Clostridiales bacterium]|nr:undecaprenyl/decaprenyl-phosphate alpha-N-acetylglucosaminyl 1-phosphate transferase [Clostridiales bacterium]
MEHNWLLYLAGFSIAFAVSMLMTPFAKKIAFKLKAIDYPKSRGLNKEPMPRIGGLAIFLGFLASVGILAFFVEDFHTKQFFGFLTGGILIVILGIFDDIYELSPKIKFIVQLLVAIIVVSTGTRIDVMSWPFWQYLRPFNTIITMVWIIGLVNAVNLIDGVDGLAAGVSSIASLCLMILCIISGSNLAVVLTAILAGSCLGFLPRNFSPAEIYMGDTGSTFLGYVLAVTSCIGVYKSYAVLSIVISILAVALPILDTLFAMIRRAINRKPLMSADRGHLHHRLIDSGYSHKQAVIILYGLSLFSAVIAILIAIQNYQATIVVFIFFLILTLMMYVYKSRTQN